MVELLSDRSVDSRCDLHEVSMDYQCDAPWQTGGVFEYSASAATDLFAAAAAAAILVAG